MTMTMTMTLGEVWAILERLRHVEAYFYENH
jgi:hypothetical protein